MKKKHMIFFVLTMMVFIEPTFAQEAFNTVTCGGISQEFPAAIPNVISIFVDLVGIAVPIILIILGMIDYSKSVFSSDDKKMKESSKKFIRRLIVAVILFLTVSIITWIFALLAPRSGGEIDNNSIADCINCFINGASSCTGVE